MRFAAIPLPLEGLPRYNPPFSTGGPGHITSGFRWTTGGPAVRCWALAKKGI